jgi:DNA polymerase-3 subunit beta
MAAAASKTPPAFALEPKVLSGVTAALKTIYDRKSNIPICGSYHVEAVDGGIVFTATNLDIEAALTVEAPRDMIGDAFAAVCLPPYLIDAGGGLSVADVKFAIDERQVVVTGGRARFAAPILPGGDFPKFNSTFDSRVEVAGDALAEIINATVDAAAVNQARYYLEGIFLEVEGGRLHAVATDGHRLHATSTEAPAGMTLGDGERRGIIVPTKAAREIARIAAKAGGAPVVLETSSRAIAITCGPERLASKLIDGTFPDWRRVIPAASGNSATVDLSEMLAALDRVMKMQDINESGLKADAKTSAVRIGVDGEFLTIAAKGGDVEANDAVRAEFQGAFGQPGVSAKYLRAMLNEMKERGGDTVTLDAPDAGSPIRVESPTDEDFLGIVMPMRI